MHAVVCNVTDTDGQDGSAALCEVFLYEQIKPVSCKDT